MKKVVMISSHYPDVRVEKEAQTLSENGYNVTFIGWDRRKSNNIGKKKYTIETMKLAVPAGSLKVAYYLPIWWSFVIYKLFAKRWDIVHAADFDSYVPAFTVTKIKRKKIIYDILDFYAEMIDFPIFKPFFIKLVAMMDRFWMKFANAVIIADDSRIKQIGKNANPKIITIMNSPKDDTIHDIPLENCKNKKLEIFFGGIVQEDRGIKEMISVVKKLDHVNLSIIGYCGTCQLEKELHEMCKNIQNVEITLKHIPHNIIIEKTIKSDLLFATYDTKTPNNIYASPNKLFEAMLYKKPIIVNENTSMADIVKNEKCGLVVSYGDLKGIKEAVMKIRDDSYLRQELGENGKKAYDEKYSWNIMESRLLKLYEYVLKR